MRTNLTTTNARIDSLEAKLDLILAALDPQAPAKAVAKPKASAKKATKAPKVTKALCKATRVGFIAAAQAQGLADFSGMSTKTIALMCLEDEALVPAGYRLGEGYRALLG